jgi:hypothetical protein
MHPLYKALKLTEMWGTMLYISEQDLYQVDVDL